MQRKALDLPLHTGKCPAWLFAKMRRLARVIAEVLLIEEGPELFLKRLSSPMWFQAFGCVLGFDWHSSGLTTTVCGALKDAFKAEKNPPFHICGGKGATSRKTPSEIETIGQRKGFDPGKLIYASKLSAKIDNSCLQDGFNLYHHTFIFIPRGKWAVIQQGMSKEGRWARRYHWFSSDFDSLLLFRSAYKKDRADVKGLC